MPFRGTMLSKRRKAQLDFIEVLEDIRVIKLDVVYDQQLRQVMNKFRALVEKG
jgi:hypothetical protein